MILAHSLLGGNVAEHVTLLLIASSHASWMRAVLLRYKLMEFFSSLLESKCVRCDTCDGYPCLVHAKSDADVNCIRRILHLPNVTLMTNSRVTRLLTNATGTAVTSVEVIHSGSAIHGIGSEDFAPPSTDGQTVSYSAGLFCLCAGAINSAVVLLSSANDKHPNGLANSSDQVGRNFMYHQADALLAISTDRNEDSYTKTWGTNDFYL
jgi:choline dehydrogenase-like flavoprotein